jgi:hypothetical protein
MIHGVPDNVWYEIQNAEYRAEQAAHDQIFTLEQRQATARTQRMEGLEKLARAGLHGLIIVAVIALFVGLIAMLPKPLRAALAIIVVGWIVWTCATYKPEPEVRRALPVTNGQNGWEPPATDPIASDTPAPRAELVNPPVRRAILVNPYPKHNNSTR